MGSLRSAARRQASMSDDWALLFARDHTIRLASLQRGVLKVEQKMRPGRDSDASTEEPGHPDKASLIGLDIVANRLNVFLNQSG